MCNAFAFQPWAYEVPGGMEILGGGAGDCGGPEVTVNVCLQYNGAPVGSTCQQHTGRPWAGGETGAAECQPGIWQSLTTVTATGAAPTTRTSAPFVATCHPPTEPPP